MYTVIRYYKVKAGSVGEVIRRAEEGFIPILSRSPGFVAYYLLDTGGDTGTTISIFDTQQQAEESIRQAAGWVKENLAELLPEPPMIITGKVGAYKTK